MERTKKAEFGHMNQIHPWCNFTYLSKVTTEVNLLQQVGGE